MLQCQQLKSMTLTASKRAIETYSFLFFALYFKGLNYGLAMSVIVFTVSVLMFCVASSYWSTVYCLLVLKNINLLYRTSNNSNNRSNIKQLKNENAAFCSQS